MAQELIGIREASRRLGVSDTAVHKAIKAGRVTVAGRTESSNRPLVAWPQVQSDWLANSDASKRSHVGSQGAARRQGVKPPEVQLATSGTPDEAPAPEAASGVGDMGRTAQGPSYAQSRAVREAYQARLAKLEYEERIGKMVAADEVKMRAFKLARGARDALMTIPDRLAPILASSTDVREIHALLLEDIERTCKQLAQNSQVAA